jgi:hypothetical protein
VIPYTRRMKRAWSADICLPARRKQPLMCHPCHRGNVACKAIAVNDRSAHTQELKAWKINQVEEYIVLPAEAGTMGSVRAPGAVPLAARP